MRRQECSAPPVETESDRMEPCPGQVSDEDFYNTDLLVVDDEPINVRILMTMLSEAGYRHVRGTSDPREVDSLVRSSTPDLVLLDLVMPYRNGFEIMQDLRDLALPEPRPPVLVLTALDDSATREKALSSGASDFLGKPFHSAEALLRIRNLLETRLVYRRLQAQNDALQQANRYLDLFAYSVSHDLRRPLRAINGFTQIVLAQPGSQLGSESADYLRRVVEAGHEMDDMVTALLGMSRIIRADLRREEVDLSAMAARIAEGCRTSEPDRVADFDIGPGIMAMGDPHLLHSALDNLINNAWKFTRGRSRTEIAFGQNGAAYYVRDNGVGFDPEYAGKLFVPFQRLHSQAEFEGTGIGLATVERIIHRHGGRVWAESTVGAGATFFFTLGG